MMSVYEVRGQITLQHDITPSNQFQAVLIFIDLAQVHFCLAHKNSHWACIIIDYHTPLIFRLAEEKTLIYLIRRDNLTKNLKHFNSESFFELFTSF